MAERGFKALLVCGNLAESEIAMSLLFIVVARFDEALKQCFRIVYLLYPSIKTNNK